jgi:DNA-binding response OmpR family regulator
MMPDMDGRTFLKVVKRSQDLREVPFIFLSAVKEVDEIVQAYEVGADDFVDKPFHLARLMAKVRAILRMAERRGPDALTGPVRGEGPLALLKFCEDSHLTGRLTVVAGGQERWADFLGGEVVHAGGSPEEPDADPLDALLAVRTGTYRIEQRRLDRRGVEAALARGQREADGTAERPPDSPEVEDEGQPPSLPEGRLSRVVVRGREVQVQTEAANRPVFTVTTVMARDGQVLRKIDSAWQHALKRREDVELARAQIERQHERVVATLRELGREAPPAAAAGEAVDPSLLAWALSFVSEQVRHHLGAVMTVALLRRTHKSLWREQPLLRSFRVAEDGRVQVEGGAEALPPAAVLAVAAWTSSFIDAAAELVERVRGLRLRTVTRMMEAELERVGFYGACDDVMRRG